jgi:hypothetical protein
MFENLLPERTVFIAVVSLDPRSLGVYKQWRTDRLRGEMRGVIRKVTLGRNALILHSTRGKEDLRKISAKAFKDWKENPEIFPLDRYFDITDDEVGKI